MLAFPFLLVGAAQAAGIPVPPDPDQYDKDAFPHWHVLCLTQLGRAMQPGEHFPNAVALAKIPADKLKTMTVQDLEAAGVHCSV